MKKTRLLVLAILVAICASCEQPPNPAFDVSSFALVGGRLVDSRGHLGDEPGVVWIKDGRIIYVGTADDIVFPDSLLKIDVSGKWVLPGLMDLHIHPPDRPEQNEVMRRLLGFGITTVRVAASTVESGVALKERIDSGEIVGPTIRTAGRLIDAPNSVHSTAAEVSSRQEIREEIRKQAEEGVDYIKLYTGLQPALVRDAIEAAHEHNVMVLGHLGNTSWHEAATSGIDAITHSGFIGPMWELVPPELRNETEVFGPRATAIASLRSWMDLYEHSKPALDALAVNLLQNNVEVNPNLVLTWAMIYGGQADSIRRFEPHLAPRNQSRRWIDRPHPFSLERYPPGFSDSLYQSFSSVIAGLHSRGVRITTGTDLSLPWMTPGVALHEEIQLLVDAGLSTKEALAAATINGAESMGLPAVGQLREHWRADLIVVDGDPLSDVRNLRKLEMVIKAGVAYYQNDLLPTD